jgi:ABC-type branched-subunit amino acid transport system ATPase component
MLKINNISSGYGKKQVLYDISMNIEAGEVVLLTGGNGSGKSTLLKCIYNLLPLWSGSIEFESHDTSNKKPSDLIHNGIVYIPQKDFYFENLTVLENLQISGNMLQKQQLKEQIDEVFELTGLSKFRKRKPFDLSGGERNILAFGMGLIHKPKLLLFDEPFAGVDAKNTTSLLRLFKETIINPENGVIIVEHKDNAKQLFTRKIKMELGKTKHIMS